MSNPTAAASIGGFFEIELPIGPVSPHARAWAALASGRACLAVLAGQLRPSRVWVPFYICDSVLQALEQAQVPYSFYALTEELELEAPVELSDGEYILYVNYFGLKTTYTATLARRYGARLLLDLTQAFFEEPAPGVWGFNSARKFFGVPDGAYLYAPAPMPPVTLPSNQAISLTHLVERQAGHQAAAYAAYSQYEEQLSYAPQGMSAVSQSWLSWLDYASIARKRQANYALYRQLLAPVLQSGVAREWLPLEAGSIPFCYPLRLTRPVADRSQLFEHQIFVPWLWPEMRQRPGAFVREKTFVDGVLALPLDHRSGPAELSRVAEQVLRLLQGES
ncbi:hypothetical protein SAMN06265337_2055 [Hymenobacter gelipurpurascens]|uniref:dTDP-4-amino-4,6-dideoxygalactose transaminase n=1 Tax=Hymenobacter gelipurpurascens TaxID=89968 RepID=A0A212TP29_9BACT|nr:hypothetical protein [Hymenobacter gelipurpurascens]SNC67745.1 hypothetical protein SAMN06265337_2055 [Hymenobacter gelipurpurascens]